MNKYRQLGITLAVSALALLRADLTRAQAPRPLTLNETISLSVKNSNILKGSAAKIEEATAALKEAVQRRLPDVSASGAILQINNPSVNLKLKQGADTGGNSGGAPKISQVGYALVNASLPLYTGHRIQYGIESSKYLVQAARLDADNDREEIVMNAIDAFSNLYKAEKAVELVNKSLAGARQRVADLANLEKNGLLARNDLLKAQLQESNTELSLLDAQNNFQLANINMALMLGLPQSAILAPDTSSFGQNAPSQGIEEYIQQALQHRKDLAALGYRQKAADLGVKATKAERLPSVALTGGYAAIDIPKALTVINAVNIGVGVKYSLSALWKNDAKVAQARARVAQTEAGQAALSDAIQLQVAQAYQAYSLSGKRIEVYAKAVEQATENYRITKNKFDNSLATVTDLLDADIAQLSANLAYANAKSDAFVAYNRLLQTAGIIEAQK